MIKKNSFNNKYFVSIVVLIFFIILWQVFISIIGVPNYILPTPLEIIEEMVSKFNYLMKNAFVTLIEVLFGFFLGTSFGFLCAIMFYYSPFLRKSILPFIVGLNVMPKLALVPLIVLWFGYGIIPKVITSALISFFPMLVNSATGLDRLDSNLEILFHSLGTNEFERLFLLRIPNSLPYLFSGLKISISLSVVGAVVGEFVSSNKGIGYVIMVSQVNQNVSLMFSALIVLSLLGLVLYQIIKMFEKKFVFWK